MHARRLRDAFLAVLTTRSRRRPSPAPAQRHARPGHFRSPTQRRCTPAGSAMHSSPTSQHLPRRRPSPAHAQRHARPEHFRSSTQSRRTPAGCAMHARRPHTPFPAAPRCLPLPFRFGHKKNGTAQRVCDAECLGRPSCGRSFGLVSRALFAAVAGRWRVGVGLRPQPWALRSRRCGRVLRA